MHNSAAGNVRHTAETGAGTARDDRSVPRVAEAADEFGPAGDSPVEVLNLFGRQGERVHIRARPRSRDAGR